MTKYKSTITILTFIMALGPILSGPVCASTGASYHTLLPYYSTIEYSDYTPKGEGKIQGLYWGLSQDAKNFEFFYEKTEIAFKSKFNVEPYDQDTYGLFYKQFADLSNSYRFGMVKINTDSKSAYEGTNVSISYNHYWAPFNFLGFDVFFTHYSNFRESFRAYQFTPLLNLYYDIGVNLLLKYNVATLDNNKLGGQNIPSRFHGLELSLGIFFKYLFLGADYSQGNEAYVVKNGGFVILNSSDINSESKKLTAKIIFSPNFFISLSKGINTFTSPGETNEAQSNVTTAMLGISF